MKVLVVGAGAVGSVYGYYASQGGADVSFLVKPKHRANLAAGITLYAFPTVGKKAREILFQKFSVLDDPGQVANSHWDLVFITVPSNALRTGDWLKTLVAGAKDATIVTLQPGLNDREYILSETGIPEERLVSASIPIVSYLAPMPGESFDKPGYAFWVPPGGAVSVSYGDEARRRSAIHLLNRGGLKAKAATDFRKKSLIGEVLLRLLVAGLERSNWSFQRFMNGEYIELATDSMREALPIVAKVRGVSDPSRNFLKRQIVKPWAVRTAMRAFLALAPFDGESFFRVHFTKVEEQMHQGLLDLIEAGKREKLPTTSLSLLAKRR